MIALLFGGCDASPESDALGVGLAPSGTPIVVYVPCPGDELRELELIEVVGDSPTDSNEVVRWNISGEIVGRGEPVVIPFGKRPLGFEEGEPLTDLPAPDTPLVLIARTNEVSVTNSFTLLELESGGIHGPGQEPSPREEFVQHALDRCRDEK